MVVDYILGEVEQEGSAKPSDDVVDQVALPENHQRVMQINEVSTLNAEEECLNAYLQSE